MRALVCVAIALAAAGAEAQEMIEIPTPPPPCCVVATPKPPSPTALILDVVVGPTYRRAFQEDFAAAFVEVEVGARNPFFGVGARFSAAFGATRVGLPYQFLTLGPAFDFRVSSRVRLALGLSFGALVYERVSAAAARDPDVTAISLGVDGSLTIDLVRLRHDGALFLLGRVGYDYIDNTGVDPLDTGSSLALTLALGYRY